MSRASEQPTAAHKTEGSSALQADFTRALARLELKPPLALAVSGGGDSTAMMHLSAAWARGKGHETSSIFVLTVDHGLRQGSRMEAEQVGEWARALGFRHHILEWKGEKPTSGLQEKAREARYRLLCSWCGEAGVRDLLLAHTWDDQAETVGMRLVRDSGVVGLAGMREARRGRQGIRILRPLLAAGRAELRDYLSGHGHHWLDDPSNEDLSFERVRMRKALSGAQSLNKRLLQLSDDAGEGREALDAAADDLLRDAAHIQPAGWAKLDMQIFRSAPASVACHALARMLKAFGGRVYPPSRRAVAELFDALINTSFSGATLTGCVLAPKVPKKERAVLIGREGRNITNLALTAGQGGLWDHRFEVRSGLAVVIKALGAKGLESFSKPDRERIKVAFPPPLRASALVVEGEGREPAVPHAGVGTWDGVEMFFAGLRPFGPIKPAARTKRP